MKKIASTTFILAFVLFVAPNQSYAAWWDFPSWLSKNQQQLQNTTSSDIAPEAQIVDQNIEKVEHKNVLAPSNNTKSSDAKTIEDLRSEVATLKTSLNNLERRFSDLQKSTAIQPASGELDISQRVTTLEDRMDALSNLGQKITTLTSLSSNVNNTVIDRRLDNLESTLNKLCSWLGAPLLSGCPSLFPTSSIEGRLKILERIESARHGAKD